MIGILEPPEALRVFIGTPPDTTPRVVAAVAGAETGAGVGADADLPPPVRLAMSACNADNHLISSSSEGAHRMSVFLGVMTLNECSTLTVPRPLPPAPPANAPPPPPPPSRLCVSCTKWPSEPEMPPAPEERLEVGRGERPSVVCSAEGSLGAGSYSRASTILKRGKTRWGLVSWKRNAALSTMVLRKNQAQIKVEYSPCGSRYRRGSRS